MRYIPHENMFLELHLSRIITTPERYFVELKKDDVNIAAFDMKRDGFDRWKPIAPAPAWVDDLIVELNEAIKKHMAFPY